MMEEDMGKFFDTQVKNLLKKHGYPVHINTPYCEGYIEQNKQCDEGCESYEGCSRGIKLLQLVVLASSFPPKTFKEAVEASKYLQQQVDQILKRKEEK